MAQKEFAATTKSDFIKTLKENVDVELTNKDTQAIYETFTKIMKETISKHERLNLNGFGTFKVSKRAARDGHNPKTGEKMRIKASKTVGFRPTPTFKKEL